MKTLPFFKRPYLAKRILDIGSGHDPFKGVTHLMDIDLHQGHERGGNEICAPGGTNLIAGDVQAIPFKSKCFDFVYASHILEHVSLPETACQEIMRVGVAGYIETPSPFLEQGLALASEGTNEQWFHKWFVFLNPDGMLVFEPKTMETVQEFCSCSDGQFMKDLFEILNFNEAQHFFKRKAKTTFLYWNSLFRYEVRNRTVDCKREEKTCRFRGMKEAVLASCNDFFRAGRIFRLRRKFPDCKTVFRKHGHRTAFIY
ncbi:MAG: methyltransferase domain-containing protein [Nitrospirae bacterium]|nr:methyltransferase domain-containing protein [Nitrospirota bacterium]MBI3351913.1 methyltransferase domain-containing protein [Nitrospirota bacterium]